MRLHRLRCLLLATAATTIVPACTTFDHADYAEVTATTGIALRLDAAPEPIEPLGVVFSEISGFYVFSIWPLRSATMEEALSALALQAKQLGADGVAEIQLKRNTGSFLFDWLPDIQLWGQAYRTVR